MWFKKQSGIYRGVEAAGLIESIQPSIVRANARARCRTDTRCSNWRQSNKSIESSGVLIKSTSLCNRLSCSIRELECWDAAKDALGARLVTGVKRTVCEFSKQTFLRFYVCEKIPSRCNSDGRLSKPSAGAMLPLFLTKERVWVRHSRTTLRTSYTLENL